MTRHDIETLSVLLALCDGKPPVTTASIDSAHKGLVLLFSLFLAEQAVETIELPMIWEDMVLMWRHYKM